ncbi:hypothetical protein [Actinoalloteichus spitiensis]|uniref:hypothetical protein n=1 Tax=Actinoalloteichus spitiensis TaxID=252394 RepID=UPI0012F6885D|nr:hypothetical protein [Actinoalloteichus spitiensis]
MAFGRAKPSGRRRPAVKQGEEARPDNELDSYLAALAPESEEETTATGLRFGKAQVLQLRLPPEASEQLRQLAEELDTAPAALVQEWIEQRLAWEVRQRQRQWTEPETQLSGQI